MTFFFFLALFIVVPPRANFIISSHANDPLLYDYVRLNSKGVPYFNLRSSRALRTILENHPVVRHFTGAVVERVLRRIQ